MDTVTVPWESFHAGTGVKNVLPRFLTRGYLGGKLNRLADCSAADAWAFFAATTGQLSGDRLKLCFKSIKMQILWQLPELHVD